MQMYVSQYLIPCYSSYLYRMYHNLEFQVLDENLLHILYFATIHKFLTSGYKTYIWMVLVPTIFILGLWRWFLILGSD
jgi:hypothetical protein